MIKLKDFAKMYGITYKTAYNKFRDGKIKGIRLGNERRSAILIDEKQFDPNHEQEKESKPDISEPDISYIPKGNSTLENLEACVMLSKYLIFKELKQDHPDKTAIIASLKTLLQSTKYMIDFDIDDDHNGNSVLEQNNNPI